MANSNLYVALSGLYANQVKLNSKIAASELSGDNSTIQIVDNIISVKDLGIASGNIANSAVTSGKIADNAVVSSKIADKNVTEAKLEDTLTGKIAQGVAASGVISANKSKWDDAAALTGLVEGSHVSISTSGAKSTINVVTDGAYAANNAGVVSGGLLYSSVSGKLDASEYSAISGKFVQAEEDLTDGHIPVADGTGKKIKEGYAVSTSVTSSSTSGEIATAKAVYDAVKAVSDANDGSLSAVVGSGAIEATNPANRSVTVSIKDATTSQKGAVQLTDTVDNTSTKAATPKAIYDNAISAISLSKDGTATTGYASTYTLSYTKAGSTTALSTKIDIAKDQFLSGVELVTGDGAAHNGTTLTSGAKYMHFAWNVDDNSSTDSPNAHSYLNVNDLYDSYTGGTNIEVNNTNNTISISGKIADANINSADNWNGAYNWVNSTSGDVVTAAAALTNNNLVLGAGNKATQISTYSIGGTTAAAFGTANKVATEVGAKAYVDEKVLAVNNSALSGVVAGSAPLTLSTEDNKVKATLALTTNIATDSTSTEKVTTPKSVYDFVSGISGVMSGDVSASGTLTADQIIVGAGDKKVKAGYSVVTSVTSDSTDAQIATAKAVYGHDAYILNGATNNTTGVEDWSGSASSEGSLAKLIKDISDLNAQIDGN